MPSSLIFPVPSVPLNLSLPLYPFRLNPRLRSCPFELKRRSSRLQAKTTHRTHSPRSLRLDTSRCIFRTVLLTVSYIRIYTYMCIYACFCSPVGIATRKQGAHTEQKTRENDRVDDPTRRILQVGLSMGSHGARGNRTILQFI